MSHFYFGLTGDVSLHNEIIVSAGFVVYVCNFLVQIKIVRFLIWINFKNQRMFHTIPTVLRWLL